MTDLSMFLLPLAASAFGGGIVAGAFSIHNRIAARNDEYAKWLRDEKTKAYAAFLKSADMLVVVCTGCWAGVISKDDVHTAYRASQLGELELVAPPAVREAASALDDASANVFRAMMGRDEPRYDQALIDFENLKREFILVAQTDLGMVRASNPISGSELASS